MLTRIEEEVQLLQEKFPTLEHGPDFKWVLLPVLQLPAGRFNKAASHVLFTLPVAYPQVGPDNFFVDIDLRLVDGSTPPAFNPNANSSSGPAPLPGNWGWFSWHPQAWRPAANIADGDNLLGFVCGIQMCLRGEEAK
jgi:hypothetical protein